MKSEEVAGVQMMFDRLLVEQTEQEITDGGIHIPTEIQKKMNEGKVLATGPGRWFEGGYIPCQPVVGDIVRFTAFSPFEYKNRHYLVVDERNVVAVLK